MYILGLHFGHDASVTILKNGKILVCLERERRTRVRHAIGLTIDDINAAMKTADCSLDDIDYCSITSTQNIEYIFSEPTQLRFTIDRESPFLTPNHWASKLSRADLDERLFKRVLDLLADGIDHPYVRRLTNDLRNADPTSFLGGLEDFFMSPTWREGKKLDEIGYLVCDDPLSETMTQSMQLPIKLFLKGKEIPGWMMSHHFAHAAYSFYTSGYKSTAILTQDGSLPRGGYWNGMCYYGDGKYLYPIMPHHLNTGRMYEMVSVLIGFGIEEGPGKMMGLAPYGNPKFFDKRFVGNVLDIDSVLDESPNASFPNWKPHPFDPYLNKWIRHCANQSLSMNYDISPLGNTEHILEPINVDIAASTQLLLEETMLLAVSTMYNVYHNKGLDFHNNLCLSGGTALNCPANTRIYKESSFNQVFIPPAVHDGGLSMGSALAIFHNTLKHDREILYGSSPQISYFGLKHNVDLIPNVLERYLDRIAFSKVTDLSKRIANRLANNQIVAVLTGRSEIGPRALGHRSILAHPGYKENLKRVNDIKKREYWRPFAPAVLESKASEWFSGPPKQSPFMLMTAKVLQPRIPAVTHVDGSSRIQTVNEDSPELLGILTEFELLTGIPIVMNTSFNGPGEPIIETAEEAISFFLKSNLDALYVENFEIVKP
jgi:carbamoyltransferase